jgi:hypothetical protein
MTITRQGGPQAEGGTSRRIPLGVRAGLLAAVAIGVVFAAFAAGQRNPRVVEEDVRCVSGAGTISCELSDDSYVSVPLEVLWVDASGGLHEGDRPECLPPTGSLEEPVRVAWTPVEVDGLGWRQVLRVTCLS